ncbi:hypothetical protein PybrP1_006155, partial [[Pythium] brassicae (nom. inval.)]
GVIQSPGAEVLGAFWRRWRRTRGKPTEVTGTVTQESLNTAWTRFVLRLNAEPNFLETLLLRREDNRRAYGLAELMEEVCRLSWDADHGACYGHYLIGCNSCRGYRTARPSRDEMDALVNEVPLLGRSASRSVVFGALGTITRRRAGSRSSLKKAEELRRRHGLGAKTTRLHAHQRARGWTLVDRGRL